MHAFRPAGAPATLAVALATLALALLAAACGTSERGGEPSAPPEPQELPGLFVVGERLHGLPGRGPVELAAAPVAPLAGWLAPVAVPSPEGDLIVYSTWRELREDDPSLSWADQGIEPGDALAVPALRLHDLDRGEDALLAEGAFSAAWSAGGALAYFQGDEPAYRAGRRFTGHVVVRSAPAAPPVRWTRARGRYVVLAWAGERLLAYRLHGGETIDTLVLEGPGRVRVLAERAAVVALSPDGSRAFVEQGPAEGRPSVRVLAVAAGRELARLELSEVDPAVGAVGYAGDWVGDRVVASAAGGLAVFRVDEDSVALERVVRLDAAAYPAGAVEPRFADDSGQRVVAWADAAGGPVFLDCRLATGSCASLRPDPGATRAGGRPPWRRPVYDPSRPEAGR